MRTSPTAESAGSVDFVVTAENASTMTVFYQASEVDTGNFLNADDGQEGINTAELTFAQIGGTGDFVATLSVAIHDDSDGEATGQIAVTLVNQTGIVRTYRVEAADHATSPSMRQWQQSWMMMLQYLKLLRDLLLPMVLEQVQCLSLRLKCNQVQARLDIDYTPESDTFLASLMYQVLRSPIIL